MKALIALEDGRIFTARSFTGPGEAAGEVVFNTSMTGYQEILTDPSYAGQMVTMTYPLIGNYGVNPEDMESAGIHARAFLMREYQPRHSNHRATASLEDFLNRHGVMGVDDFDTRALTRHIREQGAMKAVISTDTADPDALVDKARAWAGLVGRDMVERVTCPEPYGWTMEGPAPGTNFSTARAAEGEARFRVVAMDFGVKYNQLRILARLGCAVQVVPASTPAADILAMGPDGIFLSNGPGDPAGVRGAAETIASLLGQRPIFGICLGHQLLSLALGGTTYKLKFGHRGGNQPVKDLATGRVEITSQNHGFCVDPDSLPEGAEATHVNLNDGSLEGLRHEGLRAFSVQYHPEHAPGPHDAEYLFGRFIESMESSRG